MQSVKVLLVIALIFLGIGTHAQTLITVGTTPQPTTASDCVEIHLGQNVMLNSSQTCALDIEIKVEDGPAVTNLGFAVDTMKSEPFDLTFDSLGVYTFVCLANNKAVADQCYSVVPVPVPTLSQWSLIILSLLLMIIGVQTIKGTAKRSAI